MNLPSMSNSIMCFGSDSGLSKWKKCNAESKPRKPINARSLPGNFSMSISNCSEKVCKQPESMAFEVTSKTKKQIGCCGGRNLNSKNCFLNKYFCKPCIQPVQYIQWWFPGVQVFLMDHRMFSFADPKKTLRVLKKHHLIEL